MSWFVKTSIGLSYALSLYFALRTKPEDAPVWLLFLLFGTAYLIGYFLGRVELVEKHLRDCRRYEEALDGAKQAAVIEFVRELNREQAVLLRLLVDLKPLRGKDDNSRS